MTRKGHSLQCYEALRDFKTYCKQLCYSMATVYLALHLHCDSLDLLLDVFYEQLELVRHKLQTVNLVLTVLQ